MTCRTGTYTTCNFRLKTTVSVHVTCHRDVTAAGNPQVTHQGELRTSLDRVNPPAETDRSASIVHESLSVR